MKFSIIIPTYNKVELLKECLESVIKYTDLSDTEIIVVANGCTDGTESYLRIRENTCPQLRVIWSLNACGYTVAANMGLRQAVGKLIVLLNNDVILLEQQKGWWIELLAQPFKEYDSEVGITGVTKVSKPELLNKPFLIFFCVMINPSLIEKIGFLDEVFNPGYGEDFDYCMKAEKAGYAVFQVPDEKPLESDGTQYIGTSFPIYHLGTQTFKDISEYPEVVKRNTKIIEERWGEIKPVEVLAKTFDILTKERTHRQEDPESYIPHEMARIGALNDQLLKDMHETTTRMINKIEKQELNIERAKTIDGFMLETELLELARLASTAKVFIEIGSWHGRSSAAIVDNLPEGGVLYCIDTWKGTEGENGAHDSAKDMFGDHAFNLFLFNHFSQIQAGNIIPLRMNSFVAANTLGDKGLKADVIFIDGDHSYGAVKLDIKMFDTLLLPSGILCGHDYVWDHPGVVKAVQECFYPHEMNIEIVRGTSIWKTKN